MRRPPHALPADPSDAAGEPQPPSKTRLKQQSHELQRLGEAIAGWPAERLRALDLPEPLLDAIAEYQRTRSHEGRRRQMQYIGRLMRSVPVEPIREAVLGVQLGRARESLALHRVERWREELIADDDAMTRWLGEHPGTDAQRLRSLVRAARREAQQADAAAAAPPGLAARKGRAYRELFQFVRDHLEESP